MNRTRGGIEEGKEISPPRLHVKDAEKGGPKAPSSNKTALSSIPSQNFPSGSASFFPLPLRNYTGPTSSSHITSNPSSQFCTYTEPSIMVEKSQDRNSFQQDDFINSKNSLRTLNGEDAFLTSGSARGTNSNCSIIQNNKDEDKLARCNLKVNSPGVVDSLKTLQGSSVHTHGERVNKANSECTLAMDIFPDDVIRLIGEEKFWDARRTMIDQDKIFAQQVSELHRLVKVQRSIAGPTKKFQPDFVGEKPSSVVKLDSKSLKANTAEPATNSAVGKIPIPCVNNITKGQANPLPNYGHNLGNLALASADSNSKQSPSYVYPPPGNQWLVPVMSPSEGLVYKPIIGPCSPSAGFLAPIYGSCGTVSFNPVSKDASSDAPLAPSSHQKFGILSGSSLPQFLPPSFMNNHPPSISASAVEQMGQSNSPENHHSCVEVNSPILYQSSSNMSSPTSQVMSRNISTHHHSLRDKELQRSTASTSSPSKRMRAEALPLFPLAPTSWQSEDRNTEVELQPRVIKAMPHNPKSASESTARIFRSIQEERKHL